MGFNRFKKYIILIIIVFIIVILSKRYKYKTLNEPILLSNSREIKPLIIKNKIINKSSKQGPIEFSYSFWINMDSISGSENWQSNYYDDRLIIKKGNTPVLYYNPEANIYKIGILTKISNEEHIDLFEIKNINLQHWNHWVISISNRNLDIFINGSLRHSFVVKNVPIENEDPLIIGSMKNKVNGDISYIRFFNTSLNKDRVRKLYNASKNKTPPTPSLFWWLTT